MPPWLGAGAVSVKGDEVRVVLTRKQAERAIARGSELQTSIGGGGGQRLRRKTAMKAPTASTMNTTIPMMSPALPLLAGAGAGAP